MAVQDQKTIKQLKDEYVAYFADVPVQKYAAMAIARNEDTILRWKKKDKRFADAVLRAKAQWVRKKLIVTKAEYALERLEKEVFGPKAFDSEPQSKSGHIIYMPKPLPNDYDKIYKPSDFPISS